MMPKYRLGGMSRDFIILRYKKPVGRKHDRTIYKWDVAYIPRREMEMLIRTIIFKKNFFEEMMEVVKKEMLK